MKKIYLLLLLFTTVSITSFAQEGENTVIPPKAKLSLHAQDITVMQYTPDGKNMVTGSRDFSIKVWADSLGSPLRIFTGHEATINCISITRNMRYMLSGSDDGNIILWDFNTGKMLQRIRNHVGPVYGVAFSADTNSRYFYSGGEEGSIQVYDRTLNNKNIRMIKSTGGGIKAMLMDPNGKYLLLAGSNGKVWKIHPQNDTLIMNFAAGHTGEITAMIFSPDLTKVATCADDKKIIIWDVATGMADKTLLGHTWKIFSISFNNSGEYMASSSNDGSVRIWDVVNNKQLKEFATPKRRTFFTVLMKSDATSIYAAIQTKKPGDPTVYTWDTGINPTTAVVPKIEVAEEKEPVKKEVKQNTNVKKSPPKKK